MLQYLALVNLGRTIQPQITMTVEAQESLQNVQNPGHLSEDQHPVLLALELPEQPRQHLQFS
jgi:hypothetical protein